MNDMTKNFEQMTDMFKTVMPQVKPNKNGYEIRTKVRICTESSMARLPRQTWTV